MRSGDETFSLGALLGRAAAGGRVSNCEAVARKRCSHASVPAAAPAPVVSVGWSPLCAVATRVPSLADCGLALLMFACIFSFPSPSMLGIAKVGRLTVATASPASAAAISLFGNVRHKICLDFAAHRISIMLYLSCKFVSLLRTQGVCASTHFMSQAAARPRS